MDPLIAEIKRRTKLFCDDNPADPLKCYATALPIDYMDAIEMAMTIGASIVIEKGLPPIPDESKEGDKFLIDLFAPPMESGPPSGI